MEQLSISNPKKKFKEFLDSDNNHRIIFSGIFGNGKTSFLKAYFDNDSEFLTVHLFPTNYSASKNEDIFELIKFDILYEILKFNPNLSEFKFEKIYAAYLAIFKDPNSVIEPLTPLIEAIPKIGKSLAVALNLIFKLNEVIKKEIKETEDSESKKILEFTKKIIDQIGSPYENDLYTELIKNLLERVEMENNKTKTILIIDDLDRIDPDQIFRLLNVFSVHFDIEGSENKFGFDKILFCCDANNIRKIFHNKYGIDVDFNGYFDKFYSKEIFHFDNKTEIKKRTIAVLMSIKPKRKRLWDQTRHQPSQTYLFGVIQYIIENMIVSEAFSLRQLISLNERTYEEKKYLLNDLSANESTNETLYIAAAFDFMISVFGSGESFLAAIRKTNFSKRDLSFRSFYERFIGDLILAKKIGNVRLEENVEYNDESIIFTVKKARLDVWDTTMIATIKTADNSNDWLLTIEIKKIFENAVVSYLSLRGEQVHIN